MTFADLRADSSAIGLARSQTVIRTASEERGSYPKSVLITHSVAVHTSIVEEQWPNLN
jgi:hypothetical protein